MSESPYNLEGLPAIRAGAAQTVITPPTGINLAGYYHERIAETVRDDLHCRALVLEHAGERIALVSLDLISVVDEWVAEAKSLIEERVGLPPERVLICATHTHTGPGVRPGRDNFPEEWLAELPGRIADTVEAAAGDMFDAVLMLGREEEACLASNRLGRTRDGTEVFSKENVIDHAGPVDPELQAIGVRDLEGTLRALVVNYGMHVDVIGGGGADFISADWPGVMAEAVAGVYGEGVVTMLLNGACGDINHRLWGETRQPIEGIYKAIQMGRTYAGLAMAAIERGEPIESAQVGATLRTLQIPYYTREPRFMAFVDELRAKPEREYFEDATIRSVDRWDKDGQIADVPVQVLRFGDLMFVGLPGEFFTRWGMEIKHWSPTPWTFVIELANDAVGYVPTTDQAERMGYGARPILSRRLVSDAGRQIVDAAQVMMWEIVGTGNGEWGTGNNRGNG